MYEFLSWSKLEIRAWPKISIVGTVVMARPSWGAKTLTHATQAGDMRCRTIRPRVAILGTAWARIATFVIEIGVALLATTGT